MVVMRVESGETGLVWWGVGPGCRLMISWLRLEERSEEVMVANVEKD